MIASWTTSVVIELAARTVSIQAVALMGCSGQSTAYTASPAAPATRWCALVVTRRASVGSVRSNIANSSATAMAPSASGAGNARMITSMTA